MGQKVQTGLPGSIDLAADEPMASWSHIAIFSSSSLAEQTTLGNPSLSWESQKNPGEFFFVFWIFWEKALQYLL